jgi:hypothetical protein
MDAPLLHSITEARQSLGDESIVRLRSNVEDPFGIQNHDCLDIRDHVPFEVQFFCLL